jgi:sentrin-specific protease 1
MLERPGGTAYIENTFMTGFMKRDGVDDANLENLYPPSEISKIPRHGHQVLIYLAHDMVTHISSILP